jgi:hypothetical protein
VQAALLTGNQSTRTAIRRPAPISARRERARRHVVRVVLLIYLLLIFEGSLRKWVLPQLSQYIFFIRDPFVLYAYLFATIHHLWPRRSPYLTASIVISVVGFLIGIIALMISGNGGAGALLAVYGWRNYFLYAPLAFLIGATFSLADIERVCRWTLLLSLPIGLLMAAQFFAPLNSPLNIGIASDEALQFVGLTVTSEHTRPMGPFSSGAGPNQFTASAFAMLLAFLIMPARQRGVGPWILPLAAAGIALCVAMSGSRGAVSQCALIGVFAMVLGVVGRTAAVRRKAIALPLVVVGAFVAIAPFAFPAAIEAFAERWTLAASAEQQVFQLGFLGRALYTFVDFLRLFSDTPLLGYGLGSGGNASITLQLGPAVWAESDWARHIVDLGPVFGSVFILFRIVLAAWLGVVAFRATRRGVGPLPFLLYAYTGYVLLAGQVTGQGAVNGYAWLFMGFTLAAAAARPAPGKRSVRDQRVDPPARHGARRNSRPPRSSAAVE